MPVTTVDERPRTRPAVAPGEASARTPPPPPPPPDPRPVRPAPRSAWARGPAGTITRCAAGTHGCDDPPADRAGALAEFREPLDRHLRSRPADCLASFRDLPARDVLADGTAHLFGRAECPRCAGVLTVAGEYTPADRPAVLR
ncbi:hypothetical protein [Streptomyces sp. Tu 3180]|uniref:hypothetical protein n=1 Tax=Streptomyces sp. Tu 3180 TaxID=2682611 RepID=UPI00135682B5|nr:hypothetical protein [Streptomyces sp. Tu 3180]KAF3465818.1 hypothetical protein GL259_16750 [Streptomyces sp. Tu 3180]